MTLTDVRTQAKLNGMAEIELTCTLCQGKITTIRLVVSQEKYAEYCRILGRGQ